MMTPALSALARQLAASPRWRWLPGMAAIEFAVPGMALTDGRPVRVDDTWADVGLWIPDLSDPVTAAALLVLAREVSGCPEAVAVRVGTAWGVWASLAAYMAWTEDTLGKVHPLDGGEVDSFGEWVGYATEIEALASVILRGGE